MRHLQSFLVAWFGFTVLLLPAGGPLLAQDTCLADCKSDDSPCNGMIGRQHAQCVADCQRLCKPITPPPPLLDPRCGNRTATGRFTCTIDQPVVTQHETAYPEVQFAPGDVLEIKADGCVQTGGWGDTWKRYVNPTGEGTVDKYHGLVRIPTAQPAGSGLVRIQTMIGRLQKVTGTADVPVDQLILHLGYEDDGYSDNGYYSHDDGTADQCKTSGLDDGGPAHVTITIYRGVTPDDPVSRFDFNVLASSQDRNGLLYNPQWSWQQRPENHGNIPNTSMCHDFSQRTTVFGLPVGPLIPNFPDCTDQADLNSVDFPDNENGVLCQWKKGGPFALGSFTGHVNWFPVTIEGRARWGDHSSFPLGDDDYTFTFFSDEDGNPLSVNGRNGLHVEFDSDETIDHFKSSEWTTLRSAVDDSNTDLAKQLFDGHTILTGMFGMDGEHDLKAELHPLFALATRRDNYKNDPKDDVWLMFARNRGDEGFCSSQLWDAGFEDYTVRLPWLDGMTWAAVNWTSTEFEGTDGTSGPIVSVLAPPAPPGQVPGVYVTFHLGPAASSPFIDGALHLVWTGQAVKVTRGTVTTTNRTTVTDRTTGATTTAPPDDFDETERAIQAAIHQLPPAKRVQVQKARAVGAVAAAHRLPPGPAVRKITTAPPIARFARLRAIKAGPATGKATRDAAQLRALCRASNGTPAGLPADICKPTLPQNRQ